MAQIVINIPDADLIALDDWYRAEGGIEQRLNDFCQAALICAESRKFQRVQLAVDLFAEVGQNAIYAAAVNSVCQFLTNPGK